MNTQIEDRRWKIEDAPSDRPPICHLPSAISQPDDPRAVAGKKLVSQLVALARVQGHRAIDFVKLGQAEVTWQGIKPAEAKRAAMALRSEAATYLKSARHAKRFFLEGGAS